MTFEELQKEVLEELELLKKHVFNRHISDEVGLVENQMKTAEGHYSRVQYLLAWGESWLDKAEALQLARMGKEGLTELDRKKTLAELVTKERRLRDIVKGQLEALKTRVMTCQSSLAYHREKIYTNVEGGGH